MAAFACAMKPGAWQMNRDGAACLDIDAVRKAVFNGRVLWIEG